MKAIIFSLDSISRDVLTRGLKDARFGNVKTLEPTPEAARSAFEKAKDCLIFLDFDVPNIDALVLDLPPDESIIPFGGFQAKQKVSQSLVHRFLLKPFTKEQLINTINEVLISDLKMPGAAKSTPTPPQVAEEILKEWRQQLAPLSARRTVIKQLLSANPDQLKQLLAHKITINEDGFPTLPHSAYPLQSVLIVEEDKSTAKLLTHYMAQKSVFQVEVAENGVTGWKMLREKPFDLVIIQWAAKGVSGLALYNRLRSIPRTQYTPVIVTSPNLVVKDFKLLEEDSAICLAHLPVQEKDFTVALTKVVAHGLLALEFLPALIPLVKKSLSLNPIKTLKSLADSNKNQTYDDLIYDAFKLAGDHFMETEDYDSAETAYGGAWGLGDRRLSILTGYGKACYLNGKATKARKIVASADALAPNCVRRLCLLGEIQLNESDIDDARISFQKVLAIDPNQPKAKAGIEVANAVSQQGIPTANFGMAKSIGQFASYLNLVGICLSRSGNLAEALKYYRSALSFVYQKDPQSKVWFNIGIVHLRAKKDLDAKIAFQKSFDLSEGRLAKAAKYVANPEPTTIGIEEEYSFERF